MAETTKVMSPNWVWHGLVGGLIGGLIFAAAQMLSSWLQVGAPLAPLRMIAATLLPQTPGQIDAVSALLIGGAIHLVYAMVVGLVIAYVARSFNVLRSSQTAILVFAAVVGAVLWVLNFYVIGPLIGAEWFALQTNAFLQFLWHTFLFGLIIGLYLASRPKTPTVSPR